MTNFKTSKTREQISKQSDQLYKSSFQDLPEHTIYWDPLGARANRPVNTKKDMWEAQKQSGMIEDFDEKQKAGWPLRQTVDHIAKNYDTGDWSIPVFHVPEIRVANPEFTPAADMIPRETVNSDSVTVTEETDQPSAEFGLETTNDTDGDYTYADGNYTDHTYNVLGYGIASRLEDKMVLASNALRSTESVAQQAHLTGIRQTEERQILRGTEVDANGFDGCKDLGTQTDNLDLSGSIDWKAQLRSLINDLESDGARRERIGVFVDFDTYQEIANDLESQVRYTDPGETLEFGFRVLEFDGVRIFKSSALVEADTLTSGDQETIMVGFDMGSNYMAMLQDVTVKPLAKRGPQEEIATDAYGVFVAEAPTSHIKYVDGNIP